MKQNGSDTKVQIRDYTRKNAAIKFRPHSYIVVPCYWLQLHISSNNWLLKDMGHHGVAITISCKYLKAKEMLSLRNLLIR